jgi:hypothetical protein
MARFTPWNVTEQPGSRGAIRKIDILGFGRGAKGDDAVFKTEGPPIGDMQAIEDQNPPLELKVRCGRGVPQLARAA